MLELGVSHKIRKWHFSSINFRVTALFCKEQITQWFHHKSFWMSCLCRKGRYGVIVWVLIYFLLYNFFIWIIQRKTSWIHTGVILKEQEVVGFQMVFNLWNFEHLFRLILIGITWFSKPPSGGGITNLGTNMLFMKTSTTTKE